MRKDSESQKRNRLSPVTKVTLNESTYASIKQAILDGQFLPGEILTLRRIAAELGTSIVPIRETFRILVAEKVLEMLPNRSVRIPLFDRNVFLQLQGTRMVLEGGATELAAENMTEPKLDELRGINARMMKAIEKNDLEGTLAANRSFHFSIYAMAGNDNLVEHIEQVWLQAAPYFLRLSKRRLESGREFTNEETHPHKDIIESLEDRDSTAAKRAMINDIGNSTKWYRDESS
jgi:DNA-binding GntR family transcriptional regulator